MVEPGLRATKAAAALLLAAATAFACAPSTGRTPVAARAASTTTAPAGGLCGIALQWSPRIEKATVAAKDLASADGLLRTWSDFLATAAPFVSGADRLANEVDAVRADLRSAGFDASRLSDDGRRRLRELLAGRRLDAIQESLAACRSRPGS